MARLLTPKYREIAESLTEDIQSGRFRPGQKLPSETALIARFGASRITVRHALREMHQASLIHSVAGSGTYVEDGARAMPGGLLFGLVIPNLGETEIFEPICRAIADSPDSKGHALLWPQAAATENREDAALSLCEQCIERRVAGVFFAPLEFSSRSAEVNRRVVRLLHEARIPVVLLDRRPDEMAARQRCDLAGIDNYRAGYLATQHLVNLGAQRIGFLAWQHQASTVKERIRGFRDALPSIAGHSVFQLPQESPLRLPEAAGTCDAFVCANDRVAGHLMHSLLAKGVRIPGDVRITGIDDVSYAALLPVPLTTVHQPCREIGEAALRMMLERLRRPGLPARDLLLDCELVIRESCGGVAK